MYHDIRDFCDTDFKVRMEMKSFLTINQFKKQLDYLIKNYTIISTQDLVDINKIKNEDCAILTFDDGFLNHYKYVLPLLKQ